ncbi:trypsin-like serine peptidase [Lacticaseibacillus yichunensis]|uniref:Serine protease n=1 Tax=Lacticaseibacillus yichunensis TaxID=2486015 RepID=A0ABW4CNK6_9LACO|nr:trypsin-like peptidase domain-containing protein [Lacticaseibacillus yichunensis]
MNRRLFQVFMAWLLVSSWPLAGMQPVSAAAGAPVSGAVLPQAAVTAPIVNESVIGKDTRTVVANTTQFPYRAIAFLKVYFPKLGGGMYVQGTGTLIGAETVLTAGHVLYDARYGGWAQRVEVIPGYDRGKAPYGIARSSRLFVPAAYVTNPNDGASDYGLVKLTTQIGNQTGTLTFGTGASVGQRVTLAGYSQDLKGQLGVATGPIASMWSPTLAQYQLPTSPSASGSGLFTAQNRVVIVHTSAGVGYNQGVVITAAVYKALVAWRNTLASTAVGKTGVATKAGWTIWQDLKFSKKVRVTTLGLRVRLVSQTLHPNGATYYRLNTAAGQFLGYVNAGAIRVVTPTTIARTMVVVSRNASRWQNLFYTKALGSTASYYGRTVYVATRYNNGVAKYYSVYTKRGGTWLGYLNTVALRG